MGLLPDYSIKDKLWLILMRRWIPALTILIIISILGIVAAYKITPIYEAKTKLKFKNVSYNFFLKDLDTDETSLSPRVEQADFVSTEVEVLSSVPLIQKTITELQLQNKQGELTTIQQFQQQLQVKQIENTSIVKISYQDSNRKIAAQVVKTLITNYLEHNQFSQSQELAVSKDFFNTQIPQAEATLKQIEESIVKLKENNQIIAPQETAINLTRTLAEVSRQIILNRSEIAKLKSKAKFITDKLGMSADQALISIKVNNSLAIQNLTQQIQELELQLIREKNQPAQQNTIINELEREISAKQELLRKQIANIAGNQQVVLFKNSDLDIMQDLTSELVKLEANNIGLTEQVNYLVAIEKEKSQKASLVPQLESQLRQLERKLNNSQNDYNLLLNNLSKIELAEQQNIINARVISSEIISHRFLSNYFLYYLGSLFCGLMIAIGLIYILEITDHSLKTVEEAQKFFGYPWLGIIPAIAEKNQKFYRILFRRSLNNNKRVIPQLIVKESPISNIYESYKFLYSNLKFICSQNSIKTIVITSSVAQEGKSSIAANLASIMAQRGENIMLIDANLHSPTQYEIWDVYHNIGISNLLREQISPQSLIQRAMPNLDIISAGEINSSAPTFLDSPRIKSLIDYCSNIYDFIIIDSPALDTNADGITLGSIADGILLIVESGQVNRSQAKFAQELLEKSGQNILGLVFNKFNSPVHTHSNQVPSLNDLDNNQAQFANSGKPESSLWEAISHYPRKLKNNKLTLNLDSKELNEISLEDLEKNLTYLEQDLEKLTQMVKEQEDEFFLQGKTVRNLQKQVNLADTVERARFEQQLLQEQEIKNFLGETLLGQRRNLNQKKQILNYYKDLISTKENP